jgi:PPM family protein phosphatase
MIEIAHHADPAARGSMEDATTATLLEILAPVRRCFAIAALCDGVGGEDAGEVASAMTACVLVTTVSAGLQSLTFSNPEAPFVPDGVLALLAESLDQANDMVLEKSREDPRCAGMATTAVCAIMADGLLYLGWAGDTRAYLLRQGALCRLTRDHSLIEEMLAAGQITRAQAADHPAAHTITQYLGKADDFKADVQIVRLSPGDVVLVCSDGLTDVLCDQDIEKYLVDYGNDDCPFGEWAERLVSQALGAHTRDNTSVVLMRYQPDTASEEGLNAFSATMRYSHPLSRILSLLPRR